MLLDTLHWTNTLQNWDSNILFWIHEHMHSSLTNQLIPWLRKSTFWAPLYIFMVIKFIQWWKGKFWIPLLFVLGTVGVSDLVSVQVFKKPIGRMRPCHTYQDDARLDLLVNCGGKYSFVSSHATNHMAMGVFFCGLFSRSSPRRRYLWLLWAVVIGFAQVFVGVHYPFDVLGGFIVGGIIGAIGISLLKRYFPQFIEAEHGDNGSHPVMTQV